MSRKIILSLVYATFFLFVVERCAYNDSNLPDPCPTTNLAVVLEDTKNATSCKAIDGEITVSGFGGLPPYNYSINGGEYGTNGIFPDLGPGTYEIRVKDLNNCWRPEEVTIGADGSDLHAEAITTQDDECTTNNGTITVTATGGEAPYTYQLDAQGYASGNTFTGVSEKGVHVIVVKDANECQTTLSVDVPRGNTGISYADIIEPLMILECNDDGCHGPGTGSRDWTVFENVKSHAANIKSRTTGKTMPPGAPLTQDQIDKIACWVDDGALEN